MPRIAIESLIILTEVRDRDYAEIAFINCFGMDDFILDAPRFPGFRDHNGDFNLRVKLGKSA